MNITNKQVIDILKDAQRVGRIEARNQLQILERQGARWNVIDDNTGKSVGTMLDVCGFGSLTVPGKGKIVNAIKKLGYEDRNKGYSLDGIRISKAYKRGYNLNLDLSFCQYLSVNKKAVEAAAAFLNEKGLECESSSRID